jgi:hypothetical protein
MRKLSLALAVLALTFGVAQTAPAASTITPKQCQDLCSRVRCAYPTTCGLYTDANGDTACGCH